MQSPLRLGPGLEVVHLMTSRGRDARTICCNLPRHEVRYNDRITSDPEQVTCEVTLRRPLPVNPIIERHAALSRRVREAFPRLLEVRGRVIEASPDELSDDFRNELLRLIDGGKS